MDENAKAIGAVNTIVNKDGKLQGYNTDFSGFDYMIKRHGVELSGKKVVVLGNGGAAQAIKAVVRKHQAKEMQIVDVIEDGESITYDELYANHTDADVIINTSPIGMYPKTDASPLDLSTFTNCKAVLDVVYNPITTKLTAQARSLGMIGVTGLEMLVAQAKYAVEIFLQVQIDDARIQEIYEDMKQQMEQSK
jgi:shikimate dehydrogenase